MLNNLLYKNKRTTSRIGLVILFTIGVTNGFLRLAFILAQGGQSTFILILTVISLLSLIAEIKQMKKTEAENEVAHQTELLAAICQERFDQFKNEVFGGKISENYLNESDGVIKPSWEVIAEFRSWSSRVYPDDKGQVMIVEFLLDKGIMNCEHKGFKFSFGIKNDCI